MRFAQPACEIAIAASLLDVAQPGRSAAFYDLAKAHANAELAEVQRRDVCGVAVGRLLKHSDHALPDMAVAAQQLGMSVRTLRRRLAMEGHAYGRLVADHRQSAAERLLLRGDMPLKQIALSLGYATDSSFHRAFRQKAGVTPLQWRQRELAAMSPAGSPNGGAGPLLAPVEPVAPWTERASGVGDAAPAEAIVHGQGSR